MIPMWMLQFKLPYCCNYDNKELFPKLLFQPISSGAMDIVMKYNTISTVHLFRTVTMTTMIRDT